MGELTDLVPKLEGFQPIPNSVMISFMEAQSAALAYAFGLNYEFGKRTVKSMSNEKFNSLTSEDIENMSAQHTQVLLKGLIEAVPKVMPAQREIFQMYSEIEKQKIMVNVELKKWILKEGINIIATGTSSDDSSKVKGETTSAPSPGSTSYKQDKEGNVTITKTPNKPETLSENNIRRIYESVKSLQLAIQKQIIGQKKLNPSSWGYKNSQKMIDNFKQRLTSNLKILHQAQESHKRNFGKYVPLL